MIGVKIVICRSFHSSKVHSLFVLSISLYSLFTFRSKNFWVFSLEHYRAFVISVLSFVPKENKLSSYALKRTSYLLADSCLIFRERDSNVMVDVI